MPTMSHTKEQRKDWHAGKQRKDETKLQWFRRVIVKDRNFRGAKKVRGLTYTPLK